MMGCFLCGQLKLIYSIELLFTLELLFHPVIDNYKNNNKQINS